MSSASSGFEGLRGTPSTGCRTAPRSRRSSGPRGPTAAGRPAGYFTTRTAEDWLARTLEQARRGELPGMVRTGATFAEACEEFMRYVTEDRQHTPSTLAGYRSIIDSMLKPAFGDAPVESVTTSAIEKWLTTLPQSARTKTLALVLRHGIFRRAKKVWSLPSNPAAEVEKPPQQRSGEIQIFSPEEIWALVRAAGSEQDAAIFLTAAFTGLRPGELLALRWRDVDCAGSVIRVRASYSASALTTPKSGKVRAVPLAPDVAFALAQLGRRDILCGDDDLVFVGVSGSYVDGSALRRRYKDALRAAGLRALRFHDLRHTFGTRMIAKADIRRVQEWMGHADIQTTMRYLRTTRTPPSSRRRWQSTAFPSRRKTHLEQALVRECRGMSADAQTSSTRARTITVHGREVTARPSARDPHGAHGP
jgi:integrase